MILLALLMQFAGCASIGEVPIQEGVDLVWLDGGEVFTAPVRGAFLSDSYYKFQFERCN